MSDLVEPLEQNVDLCGALLAMLRKMDALPDLGNDDLHLTRKRVIEVLDILVPTLAECLQVRAGEMEDGALIVTDHHTVVTLTGLRKSLEDLDRHIVDPMLEPEVKIAKGGNGWRIREMSRALGEALKVYRIYRGLKTDKDAARELIRKTPFKDIIWKGKRLTTGALLRLRYPSKTKD